MTPEAQAHFAAMFESDRKARDYRERFPSYKHDHETGARPWWPPLADVWRRQGEPPEDATRGRTAGDASWPEAWALLQEMRRQYLAAKARHA